MSALYQWQTADFAKIIDLISNHTAISIVLSGSDEVSLLIKHVIGWCLCLQPLSRAACGTCQTCRIPFDNHVDLMIIDAKIDDTKSSAQQLIDFFVLSKHVSNRRVAIIYNTEYLNIYSANALLKLLEELPTNSVCILHTDNACKILPTIRSRSIILTLSSPTAKQYIKTTSSYTFDDNQILAILLAPNSASIVNYIVKIDINREIFVDIVSFILNWLNDLIIAKINLQLIQFFKTHAQQISKICAQQINIHRIFLLADELIMLQNALPYNINYKLHTENILLKYQNLFE